MNYVYQYWPDIYMVQTKDDNLNSTLKHVFFFYTGIYWLCYDNVK